tara:strand:- start:201 stop:521 length:321 start_codon:yes stop_codon:yes gene_type:complete
VSQDPVVNQDNHIYFLKSLSDAQRIKNRLVDCFEIASNPEMTEEERKKFLNFVIVGGGPTSCEFAGELQEFITKDVKNRFPELVGKAQVNIVNKAKNLLPSYASDI